MTESASPPRGKFDVQWKEVQAYMRNQEHEVSKERQLRVVRTVLCLVLCVFVILSVLICLGMVLTDPPTVKRQIHRVFTTISHAKTLEFAAEMPLEAQDINQKHPRRASSIKLANNSYIQAIRGQLRPRISVDSGQLRFDGTIVLETNASVVHEWAFAQARGWETVRSMDSGQVVSEQCLTSRLVPPLHTMATMVLANAFQPTDLSAFKSLTNCSMLNDKKPSKDAGMPLEVVFEGRPFVFCANAFEHFWSKGTQDEKPKSLLDNMYEAKHDDEEALVMDSLMVYGEHFNVDTAWKRTKKTNFKRQEPEAYGGDRSVPIECEYLEAPMTTGRLRRSLLYQLLPTPPDPASPVY